MIASATTNAPSARYCAGFDSDVAAAELASQLTIMKPPRTSSQLVPSMARAIVSAAPLLEQPDLDRQEEGDGAEQVGVGAGDELRAGADADDWSE